MKKSLIIVLATSIALMGLTGCAADEFKAVQDRVSDFSDALSEIDPQNVEEVTNEMDPEALNELIATVNDQENLQAAFGTFDKYAAEDMLMESMGLTPLSAEEYDQIESDVYDIMSGNSEKVLMRAMEGISPKTVSDIITESVGLPEIPEEDVMTITELGSMVATGDVNGALSRVSVKVDVDDLKPAVAYVNDQLLANTEGFAAMYGLNIDTLLNDYLGMTRADYEAFVLDQAEATVYLLMDQANQALGVDVFS